jgi:hypothetical protein
MPRQIRRFGDASQPTEQGQSGQGASVDAVSGEPDVQPKRVAEASAVYSTAKGPSTAILRGMKLYRRGGNRPGETSDRDRLLEEIGRDRQLFEFLIDEDGLNLELLTSLQGFGPLSATEVADKAKMSINVAMPIVAQLVQFGAVDVYDEAFVCSERGQEFLHALEKAAALGREALSTGE